ncbi:hypothetical protein V6N12_060051 [Hibiscus sabdariffa]|uniref:Uncharacterized protein n=1 Tax=Hibiscus sabdariffa TaxID=183260 RepID=A0ABR2D3A9_9ROSI
MNFNGFALVSMVPLRNLLEWTRGIYFIGKLQALSLDFSEISYCICDGKDLASLLENQYGSWIEEVPPVVVPFIKKDKQAFEPP